MGFFVIFAVLIAACGAQPSMESNNDNLHVVIDAGKSFSITCPTECPERVVCEVPCTGDNVQVVNGQCQATVSCSGDDVEVVNGQCRAKAMEPETPQTPQVTCPAEHCMYWTQWTSKLHTIGTNQYAPSGGERNIDIAGHGFGKYADSVFLDTFACEFTLNGDTEVALGTAISENVVRCTDVPVLSGTAALTLKFLDESDDGVSVDFKGRSGRDGVAFESTWERAQLQIDNTRPRAVVFGTGFAPETNIYECKFLSNGVSFTLPGSAISTTEIICTGEFPDGFKPDSDDTLLATVTLQSVSSPSEFVRLNGDPPVFKLDTCVDGLQNGQESHPDCGGPHCPSCQLGQACSDATDCIDNSACGLNRQGDKVCKAPSTCKEIQSAATQRGQTASSGVYELNQELYDPITAYCDMEESKDGGGWTLVSKFHATGAAANLPDAVRPVVNTLSSNWIKGGGGRIPPPTEPVRLSDFSNPNERIIQSMDWERILQKGKTYELRQRTWAGVGSTFNNLIDVAYTFTYEGYLTQTEQPDVNKKIWPLSNFKRLDATGVPQTMLDNGGYDTAQAYFYPPWVGNSQTVTNACGGFASGTGDGSCREANYFGSAGILSKTPGVDPPGCPWCPHAPNTNTCFLWGIHQRSPNFYCGQTSQSAYYLREME